MVADCLVSRHEHPLTIIIVDEGAGTVPLDNAVRPVEGGIGDILRCGVDACGCHGCSGDGVWFLWVVVAECTDIRLGCQVALCIIGGSGIAVGCEAVETVIGERLSEMPQVVGPRGKGRCGLVKRVRVVQAVLVCRVKGGEPVWVEYDLQVHGPSGRQAVG